MIRTTTGCSSWTSLSASADYSTLNSYAEMQELRAWRARPQLDVPPMLAVFGSEAAHREPVRAHSLYRAHQGGMQLLPLYPLHSEPRLVRPRSAPKQKPRKCLGRSYQPYSIFLMPTCIRCGHRGREHDWRVPPCLKPGCDCYLAHPRSLRGKCLARGCGCIKYMPDPSAHTRVRSRLIRRSR